MNAGADIFCCECGARPYPELSLPRIVSQTYDLVKIRGAWRCPFHRKTKLQAEAADVTPLVAEIDRVEHALDRLSRFLAKLSDDDDADVAERLLDEIQHSLTRARKAAA